jgi:carboxyl-terminal processing protease
MFKKIFYYLRVTLILLLVSVSLLFLIRANVLPGRTLRTQDYRDYRILGTAINFVKYNYVEELSARRTMTGAFKGMVDALDVLSSYLDKADMVKFSELGKTEYMDTGLILYKRFGGFPQVIGVRENSAAAEKGLRPGDIISAMDNLATMGMSMQEANLYLKAREEKPVTLQLLEANRNREVVVDRKPPSKSPFTLRSSDSGATVISIHSLYAPMVNELIELASSLKKENNPLILDLRNCSEGSYSEARGLINLFLKANQIGYFVGREGAKETMACPDDPLLVDIPLYVWTNRATMGPSEIAAGVLQKRKRARIIGFKTPGLTSRHKLYRFDDGTGILLTTGVFYHSDGEKLWLEGVTPDGKVKDREETYKSYWEATEKLSLDT